MEMENQRSLWKGLGLSWDETPELPREWVITNLTNEVRHVNIQYDIDQRLDIKPGRNLLCLCNPLLRKEICARDGNYTESPWVSVSEPMWGKDPKISYVYTPQDQTDHIIIKYKDSVTSLQDSIVATFTEEKLDYLKNSAYKSFVKNYQTHHLDFSFQIYEDYGNYEWNLEELWPWTSCSCGHKKKMKKLN